MNDRAAIKDPAEYRQRAERCRRMAEAVPATRDDFLIAAATWESLADQTEALLRYKVQKAGRAVVREQEQRVVLQRRKVRKALADRHPADEFQAQLLIMEQCLLSMVRFLAFLERDAEDEISLHKRQTQKRIKVQKPHPTAPAEIEKLADDFASRATASVLRSDGELNYLDGLAKAMRRASH